MPQKGDPYYEQKIEIRNEDAFLNEILKDGKEEMSVDMLNEALAEYKNKLAAGINDSEAFQAYLSERNDVCTGCIREIVTSEYKESPVTAADSNLCEKILKSQKFVERKDSFSFKNNGNVYDFLTYYSGIDNLPEMEMKVRKENEPVQQAVVKSVYFPMWQLDNIGYFEFDNKLYASNSDVEAKRFSIFEFVPEHLFFKDVCTISLSSVKLTTVFGQQEPVCDDIVNKKYKEYSLINVKNLLQNLYPAYHQQMCKISLRQEEKGEQELKDCLSSKTNNNGYSLAQNSKGGTLGYTVDFNNDKNIEYVIQAVYESPQCRYTYLLAYDPNSQQTFLITNGQENAVYPEKADKNSYSVPCSDGKQSIISLDGVNYLLTSNAEGPERLDEIVLNQDGSTSLDHYCSFVQQRLYQ